jgi:SAM-dependent methyltransferase
MSEPAMEAWFSARAYEQFVGRWSRKIAPEFLRWLGLPAGLRWSDIGCGTGALTSAILDAGAPALVRGLDAAAGFVSAARRAIRDPRVHFACGDAMRLPWARATDDAAVCGLVLNFVPDPAAMVREMARVTKAGGTVAAYVWDYAGGMQMVRHFWNAAIAVTPGDVALDQGERFPLCQPGPLATLFEGVGLESVTAGAIDIPTVFRDFDDYWTPFLGRTGAAPTYLAKVSDEVRERIRQHLAARLAPTGGPIALSARAWAVRGVV